jgi:hypothetical protein
MPNGMWVDAFGSHIGLFYLCLSAVLAGDVADAEASDGSAVGVKEHWLCAWFFGSALMQVTFEHSTDDEITFILEYYHNDGGISRDSAKNFYRYVDQAYDTFITTGDSSQLTRASKLSQGTLTTAKSMRNYLYFRASWKEPFDILYFTPAIFSIVNLNDQSLSLTPELLYNPITNLELRLRSAFLIGGKHTEYGEKLNDYKIELRARYYF